MQIRFSLLSFLSVFKFLFNESRTEQDEDESKELSLNKLSIQMDGCPEIAKGEGA